MADEPEKTNIPPQFNKEAFEECVALVYKHRNLLDANAIYRLAMAAGGAVLKSAICKFDFPPCGNNKDCSSCWVQEYCIHRATPVDTRMALLNIEEVLTSPKLQWDEGFIKYVREADKTDPAIAIYLTNIVTLAKDALKKAEEMLPNDPAKEAK